jgi:hypothetical protein
MSVLLPIQLQTANNFNRSGVALPVSSRIDKHKNATDQYHARNKKNDPTLSHYFGLRTISGSAQRPGLCAGRDLRYAKSYRRQG